MFKDRLLQIKGFVHWVPIWLVFVIVLLIALPVTYYLGENSPLPEAFKLPDQTVLSRLPGIDGNNPSIHINSPVLVKGTKCNITEKKLHVGGVVSWTSVSPPGTVISSGARGGTVFLPEQCKTGVFFNVPPPEVAEVTMEMLKSNPPPILWRVTGTISAPGYAEQNWTTQPFEIVVP